MTPDVEVVLWGNLRPHAGGQDRVTVQAATTGQLLAALRAAHPGLGPIIDIGVSIAIDGRVIASSLTEPIPEGAEVVLMQQLKGG